MKIFKNLTKFKQRILCHRLPKSFDCIKTENDTQQCKNKRNKIIQEFKRQMLNVEIEKYESKIQEYECLYQRELTAFEHQLLHTNYNHQKDERNNIINCVKTYLNHQTNKWMRTIRFQEACLHRKFLRHRRRYHHSLLQHNVVHVYPQVIVDASKVLLNPIQLDYLSRNGKQLPSLRNSYLNHSFWIVTSFSYNYLYICVLLRTQLHSSK